MNNPATIELSEEAKAILHDLETAPDWMTKAIGQAMVNENQLTIARASEYRLRGKGPFPPEEHHLGVRSGRLWQSLESSLENSTADANGSSVSTTFGTNVIYAWIHEAGGVIHHPPREGTVRLRTDAGGVLLGQRKHPNLAVFAQRKGYEHKRFKEVAFKSEGYDVTMPARAPITTAVEESLDKYGRRVSAAVVDAWNERQ